MYVTMPGLLLIRLGKLLLVCPISPRAVPLSEFSRPRMARHGVFRVLLAFAKHNMVGNILSLFHWSNHVSRLVMDWVGIGSRAILLGTCLVCAAS